MNSLQKRRTKENATYNLHYVLHAPVYKDTKAFH